MMVSTIKDVARAAGVAVGTVSRVIHEHQSVSEDVRKRVQSAILSLDYRPDRIAQSMRLKSTRVIACIARDISIPGFGAIVNAAQSVLRQNGYALMLAMNEEQRDREVDLIESLRQQRVDGLIMTLSNESDRGVLESIKSLRVPVILLDRDQPPEFDAVCIDHCSGVAAATEYLHGLQHKRIALITGRSLVRPARERIAGFYQAHRSAQLPVDPAMVCEGSFSAEFGSRETSALLSSANPPTAIIAGGMAMLPGVLQAVAARGMQIPRDISIIAGADTDLAALAAPAITAVRWNGADEGRIAVELLLGRIRGEVNGLGRRVQIASEVVMRRSCSSPTK